MTCTKSPTQTAEYEDKSDDSDNDDATDRRQTDADINFQRVSVSGEDTSGVPLEDLERASTLLIEALKLRENYMSMSDQSFPTTTARFLKTVRLRDRYENLQDKSVSGKLRFWVGFDNPPPSKKSKNCNEILFIVSPPRHSVVVMLRVLCQCCVAPKIKKIR